MTDKIAKPFLKWAGGKTQLINDIEKALPKDDFNDNEQISLRDFCNKLDRFNHTWILSNSDVKGKDENDNFFDDLYSDFNIQRVDARRSINANPEKYYLGIPFGRAFRSNLFVRSSQKGFPLKSLSQSAA